MRGGVLSRAFSGIAVIATLLLPTFALAQEVQIVTAPKSGVTAWLVEDDALPMFSLKLVFTGAGAISDPDGQEGRASIAADLLLEGAGSMDALAFRQALQDRAITLDFSIDDDHLYGSLKSLSEHKNRAFELLALALTNAEFARDAVERIRARQLTLLRKLEEQPSYLANRELRTRLFAGHPYGRPPRGTEASVAALTRAQLAALPQHFTRDNLILAVAGDINAATLSTLLDRHFADLPETIAQPASIPDAEPHWFAEPVTITQAIPQAVVRFALPSLKRSDPDFYALYLMNHILGGGTLTSRLARAIREDKGLAYYANTFLDIQQHTQWISGRFGTRNEAAREAIKVMQDVLKTASDKGFVQAELDHARDFVTGSFPLRLDNTGGLSHYLMIMQLHDLGQDYLQKRNSYFAAVTLKDIQRVALRTLTAQPPSVVIVGQPE